MNKGPFEEELFHKFINFWINLQHTIFVFICDVLFILFILN